MKYELNGVLVVEGKEDVSYLSSFVNGYIFPVGGYDVKKDTISYLNEVSKKKNVILLLDPDEAGETIRNKIKLQAPYAIDVFIDKNKCQKHKKHGVAECEKEEIIRVLEPYFTKNPVILSKIEYKDLSLLIDNNPDIKQEIINRFSLGVCSTKTMLKKLNALEISIEELKNI